MQSGDLKLFEEMYNRCFPGVNRYLRYRVQSTWDADDLTASVFIKAFEKFDQCRDKEKSTAWVFRIAHNVLVDYFTRHKQLDRVVIFKDLEVLKDTRSGPEERLLKNEELAKLRQLLSELPPEYRDVVALRYAGELKFAQIGEVLNKTEGAARTVHHRAIKYLRQLYEEEHSRKEGGVF